MIPKKTRAPNWMLKRIIQKRKNPEKKPDLRLRRRLKIREFQTKKLQTLEEKLNFEITSLKNDIQIGKGPRDAEKKEWIQKRLKVIKELETARAEQIQKTVTAVQREIKATKELKADDLRIRALVTILQGIRAPQKTESIRNRILALKKTCEDL